MNRVVSIFIVVVCVLTLVSSAVFAYGGNRGWFKHEKMWSNKGHDGIFFHKARLILANAADLSLTDDQVSKIKELEYSAKKSLIKENADIKSLALDIREAIRKDETDLTAVNSLIDQKYALKAQKAKESVQACANLKKVLTKDQEKKLKDKWSSRMANEHKRWKAGEKKEGRMTHEAGTDQES